MLNWTACLLLVKSTAIPEIHKKHKLQWKLYIFAKGSKDPEDPANNISTHQALVARALAALVDHGRRGRPEADILQQSRNGAGTLYE